MDLSNILGALSSAQVTNVSKKSGASKTDVSSILTAALPLLAGDSTRYPSTYGRGAALAAR